MCEILQILVPKRIFEPAYSSVQHDVLESRVLEHFEIAAFAGLTWCVEFGSKTGGCGGGCCGG